MSFQTKLSPNKARFSFLSLLIILAGYKVHAFAPSFLTTTKHHLQGKNKAPSLLKSLLNDNEQSLRTALKKPSKTLSVVLEISSQIEANENDLYYLSSQLRQNKVNALLTKNVDTVGILAKEQSTALGNFPGPCPILYDSTSSTNTKDDIFNALEAGATGIVVDASLPSSDDDKDDSNNENVQWIWKCSTLEHVQTVLSRTNCNLSKNAFLFHMVDHFENTKYIEVLQKQIEELTTYILDDENINEASLLFIGQVCAMMQGNVENEEDSTSPEVDIGRAMKKLKCQSILVSDACVGDSEDLEYTKYIIKEMTSKSSSTFKMTGLTGSANGHFGGVQSQSKGAKWKRYTETV